MAKAANLEAKELIFIGGDTHIYLNHIDQVKEQLKRKPFDFPKVKINKELSTVEDIENLDLKDFEFNGYESYPSIKAEMAV
jgi:thymidylate synthase